MPVNSFTDYPMSWQPDLKETNSPLYLAIAARLEEDIKSGLLLPGTKLPPQRELADYLDVNVSTVSRAFKLCEQKGIICATVGSGTFVSADSGVNAFLLPADDAAKVIEVGSAFPDATANEEISAQLKKMLAEPGFGKLFQYGRPAGTDWQKEAAAELIRKTGYDVDPKKILLAGGGQNAIAAVLSSLFKPGDRIGTDPVTYPGIKTAANMLGIQLVPLKHENDEVTPEGLLYACKNEKIKGLYLIPDYHNPTTHTMSLAARKNIAAAAKDHDLLIIEDAILSLMHSAPPPPIAAFAPENTLYISSVSKVLAPGLRLAFIATPDACRKKLSDALYNINISLSPLLTELSARLIKNGTADKIIARHRAHVREQNAVVDRYLSPYAVLGGPESIFRWLLLPERFSGESFEAKAYRAGVQVYAAERFAVGSAKPPRAVRLAVTAPENKERLAEAMRILHALLEQEERCDLY